MATYVCSDIHGYLRLYQMIKRFLKPDDIVYYLGDAGDRGPQSWCTIKTIYNDNQFIYIKGNHEDMLVKAARDFLNFNHLPSRSYMQLVANGGELTFDGWELDEDREKWIARLESLPLIDKYTNIEGKEIVLSHAGFTPKVYPGTKDIIIPCKSDLLWDRTHFRDKWDDETMSDVVVIHGHTPIYYLCEDIGLPMPPHHLHSYWYCSNHKVCIDCGTYHTGTVCLLNLDTFEEKIFFIPHWV